MEGRNMRKAKAERRTRETEIEVELDLDGSGEASVDTGIGFFDHMLELFARHSLVDLRVKAKGDLQVDFHHTVEDTGLVMGKALAEALGDRRGIVRYGFASIPMDETLCEASVDLGGRPFLVMISPMKHERAGDFDVKLAFFKAYARAMRAAVAFDPRERGVPSSKGVI